MTNLVDSLFAVKNYDKITCTGRRNNNEKIYKKIGIIVTSLVVLGGAAWGAKIYVSNKIYSTITSAASSPDFQKQLNSAVDSLKSDPSVESMINNAAVGDLSKSLPNSADKSVQGGSNSTDKSSQEAASAPATTGTANAQRTDDAPRSTQEQTDKAQNSTQPNAAGKKTSPSNSTAQNESPKPVPQFKKTRTMP